MKKISIIVLIIVQSLILTGQNDSPEGRYFFRHIRFHGARLDTFYVGMHRYLLKDSVFLDSSFHLQENDVYFRSTDTVRLLDNVVKYDNLLLLEDSPHQWKDQMHESYLVSKKEISIDTVINFIKIKKYLVYDFQPLSEYNNRHFRVYYDIHRRLLFLVEHEVRVYSRIPSIPDSADLSSIHQINDTLIIQCTKKFLPTTVLKYVME